MEKRLRSSLASSANDFLCDALKIPLKTAKFSLKALLHSISPCSELVSDLPSAIDSFIIKFLQSFRNTGSEGSPSHPPSVSRCVSPAAKHACTRSQTRISNSKQKDLPINVLDKLHILAHIAFLCLSHPKRAFSAIYLLSGVQALHDNLMLLESHSNLSLEISIICDFFWKENLPGKETLISQSLPFMISRSLTLQRKSDVHKVYGLRDAFYLFDFDDESIDDMKMLLIRCMISPVYMINDEGKKFLAHILGLNKQLMKEGMEMVKAQISFGRKSMLEAYGDVLFRAWKGMDVELKMEMEDGILMDLVEGAINSSSRALTGFIRSVLGGFVGQRVTDGVEKLFFRLSEPVIFRSLQVANSDVRLNALFLFLDLFPLDDPEATKEVKDTLLEKQFFLLERLLMDDCPYLRSVAVEGSCRILHLFWEILPTGNITKILTKIFDDMSHDISHAVRLSSVNGITYLIENPQSHEIVKVLLPRFGHLISDICLVNRVALLDLLLHASTLRNFHFDKVVSLDRMFSVLADDESQVARRVAILLMPSFFPSNLSTDETCNCCISQMKKFPLAGAKFFEFAEVEIVSENNLLTIFKILMKSVLSSKLEADQIQGFLVAASHLCNYLVKLKSFKDSQKLIFSNKNIKTLFTVACSGQARSAALSIISTVSPDNVEDFIKECLHLVVNCRGLAENFDMQTEVKAAHKFFISFDRLEEMFKTLAQLLHDILSRWNSTFGIDLPDLGLNSGKRKRKMTNNSSKRRKKDDTQSIRFEEDYSTAVGIAWQINVLLALEDTRELVLSSPSLQLLFRGLKVSSEVSIMNCGSSIYLSTSPIVAYSSLALHITVGDVCLSDFKDCSVLEKTADHLIQCTAKIFEDFQPGVSDLSMRNTVADLQDKDASLPSKQMIVTKQIKLLASILGFIVDSSTLGFLTSMSGRCLTFAKFCIKFLKMKVGEMHKKNLQLSEHDQKESIACLRSIFSYGPKLINVIIGNSEEAPLAEEAFNLVNEMLDLICTVEIFMGQRIALRLLSSVKHWQSDLVLSLAFVCMLQQNSEAHLATLHLMKNDFPSWLTILAAIELREFLEDGQEVDNSNTEHQKLMALPQFVDMMVSLSKGNPKVQDAIGLTLLVGSFIALEMADYQLHLGLLHFTRMKLVGVEDTQWSEFPMMLSFLQQIYCQIEKVDDNANQYLSKAKMLLEPFWLYHVNETESTQRED